MVESRERDGDVFPSNRGMASIYTAHSLGAIVTVAAVQEAFLPCVTSSSTVMCMCCLNKLLLIRRRLGVCSKPREFKVIFYTKNTFS